MSIITGKNKQALLAMQKKKNTSAGTALGPSVEVELGDDTNSNKSAGPVKTR